jgi:hypothetical protein
MPSMPFVVFHLAAVLILGLQPPASSGGIKFLTEETHAEAVACGRAGADCAVEPYRLCPVENEHYSAWIASPFSRVASNVYEAIRRRQRVRPMEEIGANGWGVGIYVSPAENYDKAESIERLAIRRGGRTIEPLTSTLAPVPLRDATGATKQVSKGFFAFPMEVFSPAADITIVFVGPFGEATCTLDRRKLSSLR